MTWFILDPSSFLIGIPEYSRRGVDGEKHFSENGEEFDGVQEIHEQRRHS
jgi:hypothetical protein